MRISDWSSDVCSSDLAPTEPQRVGGGAAGVPGDVVGAVVIEVADHRCVAASDDDGTAVDLPAARAAVPDHVARLARRMPQHVVGAVAVEVADHRVEALAVDHTRPRGQGRTADPDAVRGRAGSRPEAVAADVATQVAGSRAVLALPRPGGVSEHGL